MRSAWMLRYVMANEESFQSLSEESTSDLCTNRIKKGQSSRWLSIPFKIFLIHSHHLAVSCSVLNHYLSHYVVKISLFSPSLYPVSSPSSFGDSIFLLLQHFEQSNSG